MQERHTDRKLYFEEQVYTTQTYVIPFIDDVFPITENMEVLEIGCGEGGNLVPFLERGCKVTGVDISHAKIENAKKFFAGHPYKNQLTLLAKDIYDTGADLQAPFDLIMMRDVIEHIRNQENFMKFIRRYLKPGGMFFLGFPPWYNPFGGHQQICSNKILSHLPYFHLLPAFLYRNILKLGGEPEERISNLLEVKETGISIERFQKILIKNGYAIAKTFFYFINPNYEIKFGLKPRKQLRIISRVTFIRNFLITSCYYLVINNKGNET